MTDELNPVKARRAVGVSAMRFVLGLGLAGASLALFIFWFVTS